MVFTVFERGHQFSNFRGEVIRVGFS
jgi:hypothetical protein